MVKSGLKSGNLIVKDIKGCLKLELQRYQTSAPGVFGAKKLQRLSQA